MSEQTLKELGIELKKLEFKEDEVVIVEYDINKIKPKELGDIIKFIKKQIKNKIIVVPNGNSLRFFHTKDDLLKIKNRFNEIIDKMLKG